MAGKPKRPNVLPDMSKVSKAVRDLNPHLTSGDLKTARMPVEQRGTGQGGASKPKKAPSGPKPDSDGPQPNKTELRFRDWWERTAQHLRALQFQPLTLRIGRRRYTVDWVYFGFDKIKLLEIKGPWIEDDAKLKYDLFKTHYKDRFTFEMWQEVDRVWTCIR